ncbi:hypothetical protein [Couchioplanes azureus]|uniref:hypothetical protein n=1 Tax=Couchioplanes caeruleus TaxID=56438 RepID=UPI00167055E1|nr:hypothetical protein [Couchioplanes caeruleus]GGQ44620.1 hypothetical protein GCM10010166_11460 [Couchioplanes caeruleus subsp. azureus]
MTTVIKASRAPVSRPLSELSGFRSPVPVATVGRLTPFFAPAAAEDSTPVLRASDSGEQAMHRLRHPFASQ